MKRSKADKNLPKPHKRILEVDYPAELIKRLTPYLDEITYMNGKTVRKPSLKQRTYAWYYCFNNGNMSDAYRRAYYSSFHKGRGKLIADDDLNTNTITQGGSNLYRRPYVTEMIRLIRADIEHKIKDDIPQTLLEQLQIQATYDPAMFIKADGAPAFKDWEEIPPAYRCCIEGINSTRYGKNGNICETTIKLVNRAAARKELMVLAPDLLAPNKVELIHKTLDKDGKETGFDTSRLSDADLYELLNKK